MSNDSFDILVIGAGPAGGAAAAAAAERGVRVAQVERDKIGGTCLNYGCDPTKTLLHTAHLLCTARHAERYGLRIPSAEADWGAVLARVERLQDQMRGGDDEEARTKIAREQGIELLRGEARFRSPHQVAVGERTLRAEQVIVATGSQPVVPDIDGLREVGFITHKEAVLLPELPRRLAILGGGPIGIEFAQLFARFGVEVTVLEQAPSLLAKDEPELADLLCELLVKQGIRLETEAEVRQVKRTTGGKRLTIQCATGDDEQLEVDELLVAIGFTPALDTLDLEVAGVETTDSGIRVDATLRTSVSHIWAAGDVASAYQFTHVATEQGRLAAQNALANEPRPFDDRAIPWVTYTDPELAHVGQTEEQLREKGVAYTVGRTPMADVERAVITGQTDGLVKLLVGSDGTILGGHILAAGAGELIAPVVLAMRAGLTAEQLASVILPYPTLAAGVRRAAEAAA
jgi:pyruvate/2-oxoglutarate dehydrogenase complex dihydrolipoamide dehydrogenase (E3) component